VGSGRRGGGSLSLCLCALGWGGGVPPANHATTPPLAPCAPCLVGLCDCFSKLPLEELSSPLGLLLSRPQSSQSPTCPPKKQKPLAFPPPCRRKRPREVPTVPLLRCLGCAVVVLSVGGGADPNTLSPLPPFLHTRPLICYLLVLGMLMLLSPSLFFGA